MIKAEEETYIQVSHIPDCQCGFMLVGHKQ